MDPGLLPRRCVLCRTPGTGLCPGCARSLPAAPDRPPPPGLDGCTALLRYAGPTPALVGALKYRNHRDAIPVLARALASLLPDLASRPAPAAGLDRACVVTWAPTSASRARVRGFDQAEVLARHTARAASVPAARRLRRRPGTPQTGLDRAQRIQGPVFVARGVASATVVVVDDVWTTGATLAAAAAALRAAGAERVLGLTLAVRP